MFCVLNVGPAGCGGLGRARLGTDTEDYVFLEQVTLTPHLNEIPVICDITYDIMCDIVLPVSWVM